MKLFYNANIYGHKEKAFVLDKDRFFEFGGYRELANKYIYEDEINLNNNYVYPGFNDSHMHLLNYGLFLSSVSLYEHTNSISNLKKYLKKEIKKMDDVSFIRCRGFNQDYFQEKRMLTKADLDEVSLDKPIVCVRACGHVAVLNSKAIKVLGFKKSKKIKMGSYNIDTGLFEEYAINLIFEKMPVPSDEELKMYLIKGMKALNAYGVTSCHSDDFEVFPNTPYQKVINAYQSLVDEKKMTVRVNEQCQLPTYEELKKFTAKKWNLRIKNKFFRIGPLKLIGDGSLGARTAFLSKGYHDDPENKGTPLYKQKDLDKIIEYAHKHKMSVCVHCIGDGFLDRLLKSYKKVLAKDESNKLRHGIVHVQATRSDQVKDIIKYHINTYVQTIFIDYDSKIVYDKLGEELANTSYQFKTFYDAGLIVSNGSDSPVEMPDVLKGMECGVTRCSIGSNKPYLIDQALSVDEIIDTYTSKAAMMSFEEKIKGKLERKYLADFVVLDNDIKKVNPKEIHNIKVLETYIGGKQVYKKNS